MTDEEIVLSVIIVTHNRASYLRQALEGLKQQTLPKNQFEIIVVDNASKDETAAVAKELAEATFNLIYLFEQEPGANRARNIGWKMARGRYVAFMDDDAIPSPDWLRLIVQDFENVQPAPGIIGGKVVPLWEGKRPSWLHDRLLGALSLIDYAPEPTFLEKKLPFSVNMAFRKELLAKFGGFDPVLGRKGSKLLSGDETAVAIRIRRAGYGVYYNPAISVQHAIPANRLSRDWFVKRYYWGGYSEALMWKVLDKPNLGSWLRKLAFYLYGFLRNPGHLFYLRSSTEIPEKFWFRCSVYGRIGYLAGLFASAENKK